MQVFFQVQKKTAMQLPKGLSIDRTVQVQRSVTLRRVTYAQPWYIPGSRDISSFARTAGRWSDNPAECRTVGKFVRVTLIGH